MSVDFFGGAGGGGGCSGCGGDHAGAVLSVGYSLITAVTLPIEHRHIMLPSVFIVACRGWGLGSTAGFSSRGHRIHNLS